MAYVEQVGFTEIIECHVNAVQELPAELVYAGFSVGVLPAQMLAQNRPGAHGALFFYSCVPVEEFGQGWPDGVPVQVHGMDADPRVSPQAPAARRAATVTGLGISAQAISK